MGRTKVKKRRGRPSSVSKGTLREIELWAMNTFSVYKQADAFALNYAKKKVRGTYKRNLAIKGLANNLVPNVLKKMGMRGVSATDKKKIAQKLLSWVNEMRDDIIKNQPARLPKSLRKKKKGR